MYLCTFLQLCLSISWYYVDVFSKTGFLLAYFFLFQYLASPITIIIIYFLSTTERDVYYSFHKFKSIYQHRRGYDYLHLRKTYTICKFSRGYYLSHSFVQVQLNYCIHNIKFKLLISTLTRSVWDGFLGTVNITCVCSFSGEV